MKEWSDFGITIPSSARGSEVDTTCPKCSPARRKLLEDWLNLPPTFSVARQLGAKHYFTGKPCPHGHICPRFTSNQGCFECLKIQSSKWCARNQDYNKSRCSKYAKDNPEGNSSRTRKYYRGNREKVLSRSHLAYVKNPGPKKLNAKQRHQGMSGQHKAKVIVLLRRLQKGKCYWCRKPLPLLIHVDHIFPLSKDGTDDILNLCLSCQPCNSKKYNKTPMEFAGRLF